MLHPAAALSRARRKLMELGSGEVRLRLMPPRSCNPFGAQTAELTLCNPERRNSISGRMMVQLEQHVQTLQTDPAFDSTTCLVVQGEGSFFCSGADLSSAREDLQTPQDGLDMCMLMQSTLHKLRALPCVSVAAIRGGAVGGGTELALACDQRLIETEAMYQMVHARMGLSPGWGGATRLARLVGHSTALQLMAESKRLNGDQCVDSGLADAHESSGHAFEELLQSRVDTFTRHHPDAQRACKLAVGAGEMDVMAAMVHEAGVFASVWGGAANKAALERVAAATAGDE